MDIEVKQLTHAYGSQTVFEGASCTLRPHKIYGLIGENGTGKTTLIAILAKLQKPKSGTIENVINPGLLLQGVAFYKHLSVLENLQLFAVERGLELDTVEEVLAFTGFSHTQYRKKYKALSQGYKQRLSIARSFLTSGNLVMLDEPFSTVDVPTVRILKKAIRQFVAKTGKTVLISSHQLKEVGDLLDETLIISERKIVAVETNTASVDPLNLLYVSLQAGSESQSKLTDHPQLLVHRNVDETHEIELTGNYSTSELIQWMEEHNIRWTKIERNTPLDFMFYQAEDE